MTIGRWLLCNILRKHEYESEIEKGVILKKDEFEDKDKFWKYAKLNCKHCGREYNGCRNEQLSRGYRIWKESDKVLEW